MENIEARIVELNTERSLEEKLSAHFCYYYQPQYELLSGKIRGFECLLRLNHPALGVLSPIDFMDDIQARNIWCRLWPVMLSKITKEQKLLANTSKLAINVSPLELEKGIDSAFLNAFINFSQKTDLNPSMIEIEITEELKIQDFGAVNESINMLHSLGCTVAVDDFGAGFCNLIALEKLDIDGVKIDKGIIQGIDTSKVKQRIVKSIVDISNEKQCFILAEGIETESQFDYVLRMGCQFGQGYFLGRPTPSFVHKVQV